ncbi:glycosyltransferase [Megavirus baoshan]|uniref:Putative glycosyltransferase n=1 Tax=Megavirus baoshan TaxID=2496520 RepID=A0A3Q8U808_9VIRU|nr:glycosyltransferase [Megavirus baoshan]AZL89335.1 glycosyltransferase [Megavirus baoshan]
MIPKIIHQIWIQGYDSIPDKLKSYHLGCKYINDNFEHVFWDEEKIKKIILDEFGQKYLDLYNIYEIPAQKADFARYVILYTHGGIYLDMDMVCRKNLTPFLQYNFFVTTPMFYQYAKSILNGIIGCIPKHPFFLIIFEKMFERQHMKNDILQSTGTKLFYECAIQYAKNNPNNDIMLIDRKYLHPCTTYDDETCIYTCDDCYVAHTGYSSWVPYYKYYGPLLKKIPLIMIIIFFIIIIIIFVLKK